MKRFYLVLFFILHTVLSYAQSPVIWSSGEIYQQIKKLNVLGSVLYIAAHPDDENTRLLAYLANEKKYRTAYLSMTRGDGGQNLIGDEQGVPLGLIRTQELLAARRIDGAEQFFTRAFDFGYSKSPEETLQKWGRENILSDVVWIIRNFQPDIIITRFPTTGEGGHGHHTASAILAEEAFSAAADPARFPEQLTDRVKPWQARRLLWNTFQFGNVNTQSPDQFKTEVGAYDPVSGKSIGELAAESRSQHKSQGFGVAASRGQQLEYFKPIKGRAPVKDLMDDVQTDWNGHGEKALKSAIDEVLKQYDFAHPDKSIGGLIQVYKLIRKLPEGYWKQQKLKDIENILKACAGLYFEITTNQKYGIAGDSLRIEIAAVKRAGGAVTVNGIKVFNTFLMWNKALSRNVNATQKVGIPIPDKTPISQPYWLQQPKEEGHFVVSAQQLIGKPWNAPEEAEIRVKFNGEEIIYREPVLYKSTDPVKGESFQPLLILPPVEVKTIPQIALSLDGKPVQVAVEATKNTSRNLSFSIDAETKGLEKTDGTNSTQYEVTPLSEDSIHAMKASVVAGGEAYSMFRKTIQYDHISEIVYFTPATTEVVPLPIKIAGQRAGYIPGAGDRIPELLAAIGYEVTILNQQDITHENLRQFDAVITGVRAYNIHAWLNEKYDILMKYVEDGGVFLVQYNTNNNIGPLKAKIGPYPFTISRNRITDEAATVNFSDSGNSLLHTPNEITQADFENWIQERSIYHATDFEGAYKPLFSMHDPQEKSDEGSLIYTNYGKGRFIYTGLVFFRQLPAGVPGAFRLFANLIASPQ